MTHRKPLNVFFAVQSALFYRELGVRISDGRTGLFWAFFEPFIQIMIFVGIKAILFGTSAGNFDFIVFLALNFLAFNMFKNIVNKSANAFKQNKALFLYKQVKPIDTVIARTSLEVFITTILLIIFLAIGYYFHFDLDVKDLNGVVAGFFGLILFSFGVALIVAIGSTFFQNLGKLVSFMMTPLMFGSAVIYTLDATPMGLKDALLYNPLTHFMEIIHGYYFDALDDRYVNYGSTLIWTLSLLYLSLWIYHHLEKRIISL